MNEKLFGIVNSVVLYILKGREKYVMRLRIVRVSSFIIDKKTLYRFILNSHHSYFIFEKIFTLLNGNFLSLFQQFLFSFSYSFKCVMPLNKVVHLQYTFRFIFIIYFPRERSMLLYVKKIGVRE